MDVLGKSQQGVPHNFINLSRFLVHLRMLVVYPETKIYFSHWSDVSYGSPSVRAHGAKVMGGVALAVKCIDDLVSGLLDLSEKHAFKLKVDPSNFKVRNNLLGTQCRNPLFENGLMQQPNLPCPPQILAHCILTVIAIMFPKDFTPEAHVAFDKFLAGVALSLAERYR